MNGPAISVIIPVYRAEQWLARCLDSVCNQTFADMEIICVNDASPDGSLDILKRYSQRDARLVIVDLPENRGEGGARNAGLDAVHGTYTGFVDSDDTVDPSFYTTLYNMATESDADMVEAGTCVVDALGKKVPHPRWSWLWSSLYRTDFLSRHRLLFPVGFPVGTDVLFMARLFLAQPRRQHVSSVYYNYYQLCDSASHHMTVDSVESLLTTYKTALGEITDSPSRIGIAPDMAAEIFRDFFISFAMQAKCRLPEDYRRRCAVPLLQAYASCPYRAPLDARLSATDPEMLDLLRSGDAVRLGGYLGMGRKHTAAKLRERLKAKSALQQVQIDT